MNIDMNVKFNVKRRYIVNGQEYDSIAEMPDDVRQTYQKAATGALGVNPDGNLESKKRKIVFNGQEYESAEAMPPDVRQMYEEVIKMVRIKALSPDAIVGKPISLNFSKPITPESVLSPRLLMFGIMMIVFLTALLFFYQKGRGH